MTRLTINEIAKAQFDWVERMGWHNKSALEALALVASEIGEAADECGNDIAAQAALARMTLALGRAVNACRGEEPSENFGTELADIVLRVLDLAHWKGVDIEAAIHTKMRINEDRGTRGRKL